jgi:hypothetical protein
MSLSYSLLCLLFSPILTQSNHVQILLLLRQFCAILQVRPKSAEFLLPLLQCKEIYVQILVRNIFSISQQYNAFTLPTFSKNYINCFIPCYAASRKVAGSSPDEVDF